MAGTTNYGFEPLEDGHVEIQFKERYRQGGISGTPSSHSDIIRTAVNAITANQENVFTGVLDVVQDHHRKKLKKKTKMRYVLYALGFVALGVGAICLEFYFPHLKMYLAMLGLLLFMVLLFAIVILYARFGKSRWVINRRLRNAARYIDVCQVSEEYTKLMLPKFSLEVQEVCHCQLAGSSGDGFGFFPSFSANVARCSMFPVKPFTQDVDMNLFYDALVLTEQNLMDIGQPGFCWVQMNQGEVLAGTGEPFIKDCLVQHPQIPARSYLSGKLVSEKIGSFIPTDRRNVSYNYPAITYKTAIKGPQGGFNFDVDVVFGIKLSLWPQVARAWPDRVRNKLPGDVIQVVQSLGCYIVHKHCSGSTFDFDHKDHDLDWRITFAEAESLMFKHHASKEALKVCYIIVKFILKYHTNLSKRSFPALKSYHLKTVFLWLAEEGHTTYNLVKVENNGNLANLFLLLFEKYQDALEKGQLPHYFMPSVNVLASCSEKELAAGVKFLKGLRGKPIALIEGFDQAWISQKRCTMMMISLFIVMFISLGLWLFYRYRTASLTADADESFLDVVGENHKDLLKYDLDTRLEFLHCLKEKYDEWSENLGIVDIEPAISFCRTKLGLK